MTERDYVRFNMQRCFRAVVIALLVLTALLLALAYVDGEDGLASLLPAFGAGAATALAVIVLTWRNARRIYRQTPTMQQERAMRFDQDGFEIEQASGIFRSPWQDINRWTRSDSFLILWLNRAMMILIPVTEVTAVHIDAMASNLTGSGLAKSKWRKKR